jgi:hypothetical protein
MEAPLREELTERDVVGCMGFQSSAAVLRNLKALPGQPETDRRLSKTLAVI